VWCKPFFYTLSRYGVDHECDGQTDRLNCVAIAIALKSLQCQLSLQLSEAAPYTGEALGYKEIKDNCYLPLCYVFNSVTYVDVDVDVEKLRTQATSAILYNWF